MKIFVAVVDAETVKAFYDKTHRKLNVLVSYFYLKGNAYKLTKTYRNMIKDLYLDSGAYSVFTKKSKISLSEYARYLKRYGHHYNATFNLDDKFDDPEHNKRNLNYLQTFIGERNRWPIPVVHDLADPFGEFEDYVNQGCDYIALGSTNKNTEEVLDNVKSKYPNIKVHLFGNLDRELLYKYRPYSADSSTFGIAAGYGTIYYWDPDEKNEYKIYMGGRDRVAEGEIEYKTFKHRKKFDEFLSRTFGYDKITLLHDSQAMHIVNIYFFSQLENHLNSLK